MTAGTTTSLGGVTRATAASRAKVATAAGGDPKADNLAGKRKREALGEVTAVNKPKGLVAKGKEKENPKETFDGVVLNKPTKAVPAHRQPLRTVASRTAVVKKEPPKAIKQEEEIVEVQDEDAMVIDPPIAAATIPGLTVRRSLIPREPIPIISRRSDGQRRVSSRLAAGPRQDAEDAEERRVFKKRRTSSEAPEDPEESEEALARRHEEEVAARIAAELEAYAEEPEADPEDSLWDDLDADDNDDPLMVSEYVVDIFNYLKQVEVSFLLTLHVYFLFLLFPQLTTMPNPNYMESQKELAWKMRGILTDWLIQVHVRFRLLPETLFLCVNIIDRFLSARVVSLAKLQLVGVTCMFIAAKFEEVVAPSVSHFLVCADSSYTESEILQAERYVLKTLDWNLSYPNPVHYLRRVSKADDYNVRVRTLAKYLLEIGVLEWRLIAAPPSLMAGAAIWLARLALGNEQWVKFLICEQ